METLTTLEQFKEHMQITGSDDDPLLQQVIDATQGAITLSLRRELWSKSRTQFYDGNGRRVLYLQQRPITLITSVHVDQIGYYGGPVGAFAAESEWTEGTDFINKRTEQTEKNQGSLLAIAGTAPRSGFWPVGDGNIKVVYTAGYEPIPPEVETACHMLGSGMWNAVQEGAIGPYKKETLGRYAYELLTSDDATGADIITAKGILSGYREPVI